MDDAEIVCRLQRVGDLTRDAQRLVERHRPLRDPIGQRRALDELEHQRADAVGLLEPVDDRNIWMVQRRGDSARETPTALLARSRHRQRRLIWPGLSFPGSERCQRSDRCADRPPTHSASAPRKPKGDASDAVLREALDGGRPSTVDDNRQS
jgi:hypothetical protein